MTTLFVTSGDMRWAASRIRAYWPARYMDADVKTIDDVRREGGINPEYTAIVWQKTADKTAVMALKEVGINQYLDICDPLHWFMPREFDEISSYMRSIVCSTEALADDIRKTLPQKDVVTIPDRIELAHYKNFRGHSPTIPARLIWFGLQANRGSLFGALPVLERLACNGHPIELTICDDRPDMAMVVTDKYPVYYTRWELHKENNILASHDIAVLPPYPGPWGALKSNNKKLAAWASGLPCTTGFDYDEIEELIMRPEKRQNEASTGYNIVLQNYDVKQSAQDWERLLADV